MAALVMALALVPFLMAGPAQADPVRIAPAAADDGPRFNVLVFSGVTNFYHSSIPAGIDAVRELGSEHDFDVTVSDDASVFSDKGLRPFDVVIFNNTNSTPERGNLLDADQRAAFQRFINGGGGFVGWHSATGTERDWDWYAGLVGAEFQNHPAPRPGRIEVLDDTHPSTAGLPQLWERNEEWYNWQAAPNGDVHVLTEIRTTDNPQGLNEGPEHAHAWCQVYDGGRSWYTASGHHPETFDEPLFLEHILGGIEWAAGVAPGDCGATEWNSFRKVQLEDDTNLADPYEIAPLPDGRVLYIQRTGQIKLIHQDGDDATTTLAGDLQLNLPTTRTADGLTGIAIDNDFAENGWVYLLYTPPPAEPLYRLSRFTMVGDTLDMSSEQVVLEFPIWRNELLANVHMAGSMTMDDEGNLFIATGDNSDPFVQNGFTPIDERPGRRAADAQATSANTNDLRGKIIRIHPEDDGSYTIPEGNLFTGTEDGGGKTRPEIYAMGFRNPFTISYDDASGALLVADYGPDASNPNPLRGPAGLVEQNRILEAGNYGWPYCVGPNTPFIDFDFATGESGAAFDCASPVNDSPNNTGLTELPPAQEPLVWYGKRGEHSALFPEISGGGAPMSGPVYDYDEDLDSDTKFPEYYDGKWFIFEYGAEWYKTVSVMDEAAPSDRFEPAEPGDLQSINSFLPDATFNSPFDAEFGPDGSLYTIDFGGGSGVGRGSHNDGSGIYRIDYVGGEQVTERRDRCFGGYSTDVPVWFGEGSDSGVPNYDVGDGCTIMDLIEHEQPFDSHGDFVRTVGDLMSELRADGVITARERARIVSAAASSEIGKNPELETPDREVPDEKIGVVGYTVRATMPAPNTEATLAALATCGYQNMEPSSNLYGYTGAELGALIRDAGMQAPSVGLGLGEIENDIEGVIETAKGLGASYVRISGSSGWDMEDYSRVADILNEAGARAQEEGITLAYHNHGYEFRVQDGVRLYDVLVRETDPNLVDMELDLYWVVDGGADSVELIKQYPGRFSLLHVKDRAEDGSFADVGEGTIDFARIFAYSELAGVDYYFTENDQPRPDGISSACDSYAYLETLRY